MLKLRHSLVRRLLREKFRGPSDLIERWPENSSPPDRTTLWRWLKGKPLGSAEKMLGLAVALDVDPFALIQTTKRDFALLCNRLAQSISKSGDDPLGPEQKWILDFIAPRKDWPPDLPKYFRREWSIAPFQHNADKGRNYYQKLAITAAPRKCAEPQIWHFAFRDPAAILPVWNPYGVLERTADHISLYHIRGHSASVAIPSDTVTFLVETWFGPRPAQFRVASLHPFILTLREIANGTPCVRFP